MELIELRIKRNTYGAVVDGIEPGKMGGLVTFRTEETGTPSVVMVALSDAQINDILYAIADGTEETATRMMAGISAGGIRAANDLAEARANDAPAVIDSALGKVETAHTEAQRRGGA